MAVRPAYEADVSAILQLIRDLAEYEKAPEKAVATEDDLKRAFFGERPAAFAHVVEHEGEIGGYAIWFLNFSTWTGHHGIYLEDLYVKPELRGHGYGTELLTTLAKLCNQRGYTRLEWMVLDWNTPSIGFYKSLGAESLDGWTTFRLSGDSLRQFTDR